MRTLRLHSAGSTLPHLWPTGFISGWPPSITARYFSSCPSDSTSRWTPCLGNRKRWLQVSLGCVRLSPSCPFSFSIPSSLPAHEALPPRSDMALLIERQRDFNPPDQRAAQPHYAAVRLPPPCMWIYRSSRSPRPRLSTADGNGASRSRAWSFLCVLGVCDSAGTARSR